MSIVAGFQCAGGIVICTDTQITSPGHHKSYARKMHWHGGSNWKAIFAYSGSTIFNSGFNAHFKEQMIAEEESGSPTEQKIRDCVYRALYSLGADDRDGGITGADLICGILVDSQVSLYGTKGSIVSKITDDYVITGEASLTKYLLPMLLKGGVKNIDHAVIAGTYLIRAAKIYIDGCGGDTHIWVLRPTEKKQSGAWVSMDPPPQLIDVSGSASDLDKEFDALENLASSVISGLLSQNAIRPKLLADLLSRLIKRITDDHGLLAAVVSNGQHYTLPEPG